VCPFQLQFISRVQRAAQGGAAWSLRKIGFISLALMIVIITKHRAMLNVSTSSVFQNASQRRRLNKEVWNTPFPLIADLSSHPSLHIPVSTIALATAASAAVAVFDFLDYDRSDGSESDEEDAEKHHPGNLEHDDDYHGDRYGVLCNPSRRIRVELLWQSR
jgi:hypothetical protein